jgi:hypothetical protein
MTNPDTVIPGSTPAGCDNFPMHRPPPFSKLDFVSFKNEPITEGKIRHRTRWAQGHPISILQQ